MKIRLLADIAISLLLARFKQTLVAAIGVTFSITMFISLLGFMEGLNTLLDNLVLTGHLISGSTTNCNLHSISRYN